MRRRTETLFGGIVTLVGFPLGVGAVAGGWLAGRRSVDPVRASLLAGVLGTLPWGLLVTLGTLGAVPQLGYHSGWVHVGVNPAPAGAFGLPVALAFGAMVLGTGVGLAAVGGVGSWLWKARGDPTTAGA